ncbi:toxin-antitoxin system HicB family antitoxin [Nocardia sp. NPDC059180]|uniref:toxin-antitoxin system HicB family antitoxin n=1 Tax=Nocardia sp. NPDC059180 TaxID=3346761 RepID=UPI00369B63DE
MTTISVRLPDEIHQRLTAAAEADHISLNSALVQAAQAWVDAQAQRARSRVLLQEIMAEDAELLAMLGDE